MYITKDPAFQQEVVDAYKRENELREQAETLVSALKPPATWPSGRTKLISQESDEWFTRMDQRFKAARARRLQAVLHGKRGIK